MPNEQPSTSISYAITVRDEVDELNRLLQFLTSESGTRWGDGIVVQIDNRDNPALDEVKQICKFHLDEETDKVVEFPLNGDFSEFKNNIKQYCGGDYIFYIDADEVPTQILMNNIKTQLKVIEDIVKEPFILYLPRVNIVHGLTEDDIKKWGWNVNELGHINFPDYQGRICRNTDNINWEGKVHERLKGGGCLALDPTIHFSLHHIKSIEKQRKQNKFYETI